MKIEIDLKDVLADEYGDMESLAESIKRQVIDNLTSTLAKGISKKIDEEVSGVIQEEVKKAAEKVGSELVSGLIDYEYTPIDRYGSREEPTTMRNEFIKSLTSQMVYKQTKYNSDKTEFTKSVDAIIASELEKFKKEYNSKIDEIFTKEAFEYATTKMKMKLGLV